MHLYRWYLRRNLHDLKKKKIDTNIDVTEERFFGGVPETNQEKKLIEKIFEYEIRRLIARFDTNRKIDVPDRSIGLNFRLFRPVAEKFL